ncbi:MAG: hypothetical protein NVSMB6_11100 [Burkholderiaceae bacterium]
MGMAIEAGRIEAMVAQIRLASTRAQVVGSPLADVPTVAGSLGTVAKPDFAAALKVQLDQVNDVQTKADQMGQRFSAGDDTVSLSDVMIASQKANIGFQATIQVRNKLVSAYHDIMAMQV